MTPERWQQIRVVFEEAELLGEAERAQYLDRACAGDAELREEAESLLAAAASAGGEFMDKPAVDLMENDPEPESGATRIGRRIGVYKIIAEIGRGGMGEVYRAVRIDGQFDQEVAIKLVRAGRDTAFVVQRFLQERQILASLNHPNIARLLDGGTTDDEVPYLVMELIEGERIDVYCESRKLSVSERLRLFLDVCEAVQYAHQRLVVHRDLKPSNILVTKDGVPKLLDFGIAKMLDPAADAETTVARPMTPEYASPEQIRGETITTATDVYSLGVILYQLLTGHSPYGAAARTPHEISRAIADTQPHRPSSVVSSSRRQDGNGQKEGRDPAPSSRRGEMSSSREPTPDRLRRRLMGDVDNILLMALRKEPELRYGSAQQLADDISRHLNGLPVNAAKGSWSYFARKFIARHRAGLAATALIMLALAAGIVATQRQARIAQTERARAQKRFDDVRRFSDSLIFEIHDALEAIPGTTAARSLLLDRAVQYLDAVSKDAEGDSELQRELAQAYQRLATVQGDATVSNTGQVSAAEASTHKAIVLFEAVAGANPNNTIDQLNVAMAHRRKGISDIYYPDGRPEIEKAIAITDGLLRTDGANSKVLMERAVELQGLAMCFDIAGDRKLAVDAFQKALAMLDAIGAQDPGYRRLSESRAKFLVEYGGELAYAGALDKAREEMQAGVSAYQTIVDKGAQPGTVRDLAESRLRLGRIDLMENDVAAASRNYVQARAAMERLAKADSGNMQFRMDLLSLDFQQARLAELNGQFSDAEAQLLHVIEGFKKAASEEDTGPGDGVLYTWLGEAQSSERNYSQALQSFQKAVAALESDVQYDDERTGQITDYVLLGDTHLKLGHYAEAEAAYNKAQSLSDLSLAETHGDVPALYAVAETDQGIGDLWIAKAARASDLEEISRDGGKACDAYRASLGIRRGFQRQLWFSSSEYPIAEPISDSDYKRRCETAALQSR